MFERLFVRIDILPGFKTVILATGVTGLFWGHQLGIVPIEVMDAISPWLIGAMAPTVAARLLRK